MIPYCTIWYHIVQYGTILYNIILYYIILIILVRVTLAIISIYYGTLNKRQAAGHGAPGAALRARLRKHSAGPAQVRLHGALVHYPPPAPFPPAPCSRII